MCKTSRALLFFHQEAFRAYVHIKTRTTNRTADAAHLCSRTPIGDKPPNALHLDLKGRSFVRTSLECSRLRLSVLCVSRADHACILMYVEEVELGDPVLAYPMIRKDQVYWLAGSDEAPQCANYEWYYKI